MQRPVPKHASMTWAQRLKRVFAIEIETCRRCGGKLRVIASIEDPELIERTLAHLDQLPRERTAALAVRFSRTAAVAIFAVLIRTGWSPRYHSEQSAGGVPFHYSNPVSGRPPARASF